MSPWRHIHGSYLIMLMLLRSTHRGQGPFKYETVLPGMGIFVIKIRRSWCCLIFIMGISTLVRRHLDIDTSPSWRRYLNMSWCNIYSCFLQKICQLWLSAFPNEITYHSFVDTIHAWLLWSRYHRQHLNKTGVLESTWLSFKTFVKSHYIIGGLYSINTAMYLLVRYIQRDCRLYHGAFSVFPSVP